MNAAPRTSLLLAAALMVGLPVVTVPAPAGAAPVVSRLAGDDRFATAAAISRATFGPGVAVAYVATSDGFADGLVGGAAAARRRGPVLLTGPLSLPAATGTELARLTPAEIVVLGGPGVISDAVVAALASSSAAPVRRLAGVDRYATAAAVSADAFGPGVGLVHVANGGTFADALAAGPSAGVAGGPVLLVDTDALPAPVAAELARLRPGAIRIVGGPAAVSANVQSQLGAFGATVTRVAGDDRYATAAALALAAFPTTAPTVHLATGADYPDALAGGPAAALAPGPILLAQPTCIPAAARAQITRLAPAALVLLGGAGALGIGVETGTACGAGSEVGGAMATGTLSPDTTPVSFCPAGTTCQAVTVSCPGARLAARAVIAIGPARGVTRGVAVLFSGGDGTGFWSRGESGTPLAQLQDGGLTTVQVAWVDGWLMSTPGEEAGHARLACRPATAIRWAHDNLFAPLGLPETAYRCGFCITGNSGGASQVSYALSHYGLDTILDAVVPTGGPPHADLAKGCLRVAGQEAYWYGEGNDDLYGGLDGAYGFGPTGGPCQRHDAGYVGRWAADSIATGGNDFIHAATRIHFIQGTDDRTVSPTHGGDYANRLRAAGSPRVTVQVVASGHSVQRDPEGAAAIVAALLAP